MVAAGHERGNACEHVVHDASKSPDVSREIVESSAVYQQVFRWQQFRSAVHMVMLRVKDFFALEERIWALVYVF